MIIIIKLTNKCMENLLTVLLIAVIQSLKTKRTGFRLWTALYPLIRVDQCSYLHSLCITT
jgi:hypothetical protein